MEILCSTLHMNWKNVGIFVGQNRGKNSRTGLESLNFAVCVHLRLQRTFHIISFGRCKMHEENLEFMLSVSNFDFPIFSYPLDSRILSLWHSTTPLTWTYLTYNSSRIIIILDQGHVCYKSITAVALLACTEPEVSNCTIAPLSPRGRVGVSQRSKRKQNMI